MTKITLKPGDYVRTEGMTEEQYYAVAKAFMEAGAKSLECPSRVRDYPLFGWALAAVGYERGLWHAANSVLFERELTIAQILGAEPDADGWIEWHGGECPVEKGVLVDVRYDDGAERKAIPALTSKPMSYGRTAEDWNTPRCESSIIAYRIHQPEQESPMTIEQLLTKANKHAAKAAKHEAKRKALVERARELLPEGWRLENSGLVVQPAEDMADPANWKAGDVVECVSGKRWFTEGKEYKLTAWPSTGKAFMRRSGNVSIIDDMGDDYYAPASSFKWISRPSAQGGE